MSDLSIGQRQMVSILTALNSGADLIIMDEPTASLAVEERELVYLMVRHLAQQEGKAVLFVSHFLDEIIELTDCVTVLRDGQVVFEEETKNLDETQIAEAIVGREVVALEREARSHKDLPDYNANQVPLLELKDLSSPGKFEPISLCVQPGEVIGVAGLLGSGRSELIHAIFRADRHAKGEVKLAGKPIARSTGAAVRAGMAIVPEDRMGQGLIPGFEIWRNTTLPVLDHTSWRGIVPLRTFERERGRQAIKKLNIKAGSPDILVSELSGGNAQKVTIGKWLFSNVKVYLLDEPTAGIDIGAKTDILRLIRQLAQNGACVIVVSSEFEELLTVSNRILVMRDGNMTDLLDANATNEHDLVLLAGGAKAQDSDPLHKESR